MVSVSDFKPENMKWEEITDRSKVAVEEALSGLLGEEKASGTRQDPLVGNLQDADYLMTKLQARERYRSYDAFRQMKSRETRKKHLRYLVRISVAACLVIGNRSSTCRHHSGTRRTPSGRNESNIGEN